LLCVMREWKNGELIYLLHSNYEKVGFVQQVTGKRKRSTILYIYVAVLSVKHQREKAE